MHIRTGSNVQNHTQKSSPRTRKNRRKLMAMLAMLGVAGVGTAAQAATGTWTGGAGANWDTTATNWSGVAGTPWDSTNGPSNVAAFGTASTATLTSSVFASSITFGSTTTTLGIAVTGSNSFTITGGFAGTGITAGTGNILNKTGSGTLTLATNAALIGGDANVNFNAGYTIEGGGSVVLLAGLKAASTSQSAKGNFTNLIGSTSANNTLTISTAGQVLSGGITIGGSTFGSNALNISNPGSLATPSYNLIGSGHQLNLGVSSSSNTVTISNGAYFRQSGGGGTNTWTIGTNAGANSNSITITGTNSTLDRGGAAGSFINVGAGGSSNSISVLAGGTLLPRRLAVGTNGGDNNFVTIDGTNSQFAISGDSNGILEVGIISGSNGNSIAVQNGGLLTYANTATNRDFSVGRVAGSTNNFLKVTGASSNINITHTQPLTIGGFSQSGAFTDAGNTAVGNHLDVFSGGTLTTNTSIYLGGGNTGVSSDPDYTGQTNLTSFNLGNGTGTSTANVSASTGYTAGVVLNTANTVLNFNAGKLVAGANGALVSGSGAIVFNGDGIFSTTQAGSTVSNATSGTGTLIKEGSGLLTLSNASLAQGKTTVTAGTLTVSTSGALTNNGSSKVSIAADADNDFATGVIPTLNRAIASGTAATGAGSKEVGNIGNTGDILNSVNLGSNATLLMEWRGRNNSVVAGETTNLSADIIRITGIDTNKFVLQMNYVDGDNNGFVDASGAAVANLVLGWLNAGTWVTAISGNHNPNTGAQENGAWVNDSNHLRLGDYGVDTTNKVVWAVVDHNSDFSIIAVVGIPAPASLPAGLALMTIVGAFGRRRFKA